MSVDIEFNEYNDVLDDPYVVRATKSFSVYNKDCDEGGDGWFQVAAGTEWLIELVGEENDLWLDGTGEMTGWYLDISRGELDRYFEVIHEGGYDEEQA